MVQILIVVLILTFLAGINYYLAYRLYQGFSCFFAEMKLWPVLAIVLILTLLLVLSFGRAFLPFSKGIKDVFGIVGGYCMGIFLYLLFYTVIAELILLVMKIVKLPFATHRFINGYMTIGVLLITCITCVYGFVNAKQIKHVSYEITLQGKKDISDLKVVMISDLHLGAIGSEDKLERIVDEINSLNPDLVCVAGDFFDTDFTSIKNPTKAIKTLQGLQTTYGVYASLGNHDGGQTHDQMFDFLEQANIKLLADEYTIIDERLVLIGRLDAHSIGGYGEKKRKELSDFFVKKDSDMPVIVLDHNPAHIDEYNEDIDVVLCGHTHKGQIFPANLITGMMYAVDYGYYRAGENSPQVVVSSGVGYWGMPMRVGTNCEIVTLRFTD